MGKRGTFNAFDVAETVLVAGITLLTLAAAAYYVFGGGGR